MKIFTLSAPLSTLAIERLTKMASFLEALTTRVTTIPDICEASEAAERHGKGFNLDTWDCGFAACAMGWAAGPGGIDPEHLWLTIISEDGDKAPVCRMNIVGTGWHCGDTHNFGGYQTVTGWDAAKVYFCIPNVRASVEYEPEDEDFRTGDSDDVNNRWDGKELAQCLFSGAGYPAGATPLDVATRIHEVLALSLALTSQTSLTAPQEAP